MKKKILVTGGAGFIASHITDEYISMGHDVTVVDNLSRGNKDLINPKAKFLKTDFDSPKLLEWIAKEKPDIINHHAAQIEVSVSVKNPVLDAEMNIIASLRLIEAASKAGVGQFIFASTGGAMYGDDSVLPGRIEDEAKPDAPYGIAKLSFENYLRFFHKVHGIDITILRYSNVFGPRQNPWGEAGVVAIFFNAIKTGKTPTIFGTGKQTRDYVFVGDVVRANVLALGKTGYEKFNVGTGIETDLNTLVEKIYIQSGKEEAFKDVNYADARPGELQRSCLDISRTTENLKYKPETSIDDGLKATKDYFWEK